MKVMVVLVGVVVAACGGKKDPPRGGDGTAATGSGSATTGSGSALRRPPVSFKRPGDATFKPGDFDSKRKIDLDALGFASFVDPKICFKPPQITVADVDVNKGLFVHDGATIDNAGKDFSLNRVLTKLAADAKAGGAPSTISASDVFIALWDSQNTTAAAKTPAVGTSCDADGGTLNGFPNPCRPVEGAQANAANIADEIKKYKPIGLVNRMDLAADGWKNCGEHRIIYGREDGDTKKNLVIFEAVLPNPRPGCASGCRPVAEQWLKISKAPDAATRAQLLEELFFTKIPNTNLREVVNLAHYTAKPPTSTGYGGPGSGQIRFNMFLDGFKPPPNGHPWVLKEVKLVLDCTAGAPNCVFDAVPIPVKVNPDGNLWTEGATGLAVDFQQAVLPQVADLAKPDLNTFSYQVPVVFDAARSQSLDPPPADHYLEAYAPGTGQPGGFQAALENASTPHGLTDVQIVNRAAALSCAGCHQPSAFGLTNANSIGTNMKWPEVVGAGFTHIEISGTTHALSPALVNEFLPARAKNFVSILNADVCLCRLKKPGIPLPKFEQLERELFPDPPRDLADLRSREQRLKQKLDAARAPLSLPKLDDNADVSPSIKLAEVASEPDAAKKPLARIKAVQKIVRDEPPRKTVTGHFRVH